MCQVRAAYANALRRCRARPGDKWHVDEVFITISGQRRYLWRAVDQHGTVLDILVTARRDTTAATRFFRKLLKGLGYAPRVLITAYRNGATAASLAATHGMSFSSIKRLLHTAGVHRTPSTRGALSTWWPVPHYEHGLIGWAGPQQSPFQAAWPCP